MIKSVEEIKREAFNEVYTGDKFARFTENEKGEIVEHLCEVNRAVVSMKLKER